MVTGPPLQDPFASPWSATQTTVFDRRGHQHEQSTGYDMHTKPLKPLPPGDSVRMQLPGQKAWSPGVCAGLVGPRSYEVKAEDRILVQNHQHLIKSEEPVDA